MTTFEKLAEAVARGWYANRDETESWESLQPSSQKLYLDVASIAVRAFLATLSTLGLAIVPVEATEEMVRIVSGSFSSVLLRREVTLFWAAMIAAAPSIEDDAG